LREKVVGVAHEWELAITGPKALAV
jgi:hypothetical protein